MDHPHNHNRKHDHSHSSDHSCCSIKPKDKVTQSLVKDPVCGMMIDPSTAKGGSTEHSGETFYFCNPKCKTKFEADPSKYLAPKPEQIEKVNKEAIYTCPMHPEVRKKGQGNCPICGMALEPEEVSLEEVENPELVDFTKRLKVGVPLAVALLLLAMSDLIPGQPVQHTIPNGLNAWIQFLLATPVVLWGGLPFFERGWASLKSRNFNMFTLIALGTGVAYLFSLVGTLFPSIFPDSLKTHGGMVPLYYEAAAVITALVLLGQVLELRDRKSVV